MKDEFALIDEIRRTLGPVGPRVRVGIGDDAAVLSLPQGEEILFCSDAMVEGVHFDLSFASAHEVGHKALATCLSDLAAMNGQPLAAVVSIALPRSSETFLCEFYEGASALVRSLGVDVVGGDLTSSPGPIFVDVSVIGSTKSPWLRSGARDGDLIAVSGAPGASAAGLAALRAGHATHALRDAHLRPRPRFDLLEPLSPNGLCRAAIDVSDGLSSECHHLARASKIGIALDASLIPLHPDAVTFAKLNGLDPLEWALNGGEDYELLVALDPATVSVNGCPRGFTIIGKANAAAGHVTLRDTNGATRALPSKGFNHFPS